MPTSQPGRLAEPEFDYPGIDQPMADNSPNAERMVDTYTALREGYRRRGEVALATVNLAVYPVKGQPWVRNAPDVLVAPGADPDRERASFRYWEEAGPIRWGGEFLSFPSGERLESTEVQERIEFYRSQLETHELFIYQPLGLEFDAGFVFTLLRLGADRAYHPVAPGGDGWYRSEVLPFHVRPTDRRLDVRDAETLEVYLCDRLRAAREAERAAREAVRAEREAERRRELEARVRELEERLGE